MKYHGIQIRNTLHSLNYHGNVEYSASHDGWRVNVSKSEAFTEYSIIVTNHSYREYWGDYGIFRIAGVMGEFSFSHNSRYSLTNLGLRGVKIFSKAVEELEKILTVIDVVQVDADINEPRRVDLYRNYLTRKFHNSGFLVSEVNVTPGFVTFIISK